MTSHTQSLKVCLSCGKTVKGRADKKFCDDYCRNNYNNQLKGDANNTIRNINNILRKNRQILYALLPEKEETRKVYKDKLITPGFQFKYGTHQLKTNKGLTYFYCYDYGYLELDNNWYLIVRSK